LELSSDQRLEVIAARLKVSKLTDDDYSFYLKKGEWSEFEAVMLLSADPEKVRRWYDLIESDRKSEKLLPSRYERRPYLSKEDIYYYDPIVITSWAISKKISIPNKLVEWYGQQGKPIQAATTQLESEQTNQPGNVVSAQSEENPIKDSEQTRLLKHIGLLALVLAEKSNQYKISDRPNANSIADSVQTIVDALPDANRKGCSDTNIRDSIAKGLNLLNK
jgi:hypothetical protein